MDTRLIGRKPRLVLAVVSILLLSAVPSAMAELGQIDVHGFASQGYMESTNYNYLTPSLQGSWAMAEYAVNVGSELNPDLRIGVQFFARNLGELGKNSVGVDWAFGDYHRYDWLGVRGGRVKIPYGLYGETADYDHVRTAVLMPQSVYDIRMRDMRTAINGLNPYGYIDMKAAGGIDYSAVFGFVAPSSENPTEKFFNDSGIFTFGDMENEYTLGGQLMWNTPINGLRVGHSFLRYKSNLTLLFDPMIAGFMGIDPVQQFNGNLVDINTTSAELTYGNILLAGEYNTWQGDFDANQFDFAMDWENWYVLGSYRLNAWFELGSYYSVHYEDRKDREGANFDPNFSGWQKDLALSARFDVSPFMIFKLEGHRMDGNALILNQDNLHLVDDPSQIEQNWYMFTGKVSFVF